MRQFTVFTASTEHDSKTINTITYTCFNSIFEFDYHSFHGITFPYIWVGFLSFYNQFLITHQSYNMLSLLSFWQNEWSIVIPSLSCFPPYKVWYSEMFDHCCLIYLWYDTFWVGSYEPRISMQIVWKCQKHYPI